MARKRLKTTAERQELADEQGLEQLYGVLQLCCTKVALETSMRLLGRLAASSKKLQGVVSTLTLCVAQLAIGSHVLCVGCSYCSSCTHWGTTVQDVLQQYMCYQQFRPSGIAVIGLLTSTRLLLRHSPTVHRASCSTLLCPVCCSRAT
jgi:hypothetical protein